MSTLEEHYLRNLPTLRSLKPKRALRSAMSIIVLIILLVVLTLMLTPWRQTASGRGIVSSLNPENQLQTISALVPGQIKKWHVHEGQAVEKGDPIVTITDQDQKLVERLNSELEAIRQEYEATQAALVTTEKDLVRRERLYKDGLVSQRDFEQARLRVDNLRAKVTKTEAAFNRAQVKLARQTTQTQYAPQNGFVVRLLSAGLTTYVKEGAALASFIPKDVDRAVAMEVRGLDAPLVTAGRKVRLQFEGWPVFQFSGWPDSAIGTFGGVVRLVEPSAVTSGNFRVWIEEDPADAPWPDDNFVRLGSRAKGWILLEEVSLGYELWRQLNNFPPEYPPKLRDSGKSK